MLSAECRVGNDLRPFPGYAEREGRGECPTIEKADTAAEQWPLKKRAVPRSHAVRRPPAWDPDGSQGAGANEKAKHRERHTGRSLHGGIVQGLRCVIPNHETRVQIPLPPPKVRKTEAPGILSCGRHPTRLLNPSKYGRSAPGQVGRAGSDSVHAQPGRVPAGRRTTGEVPVGIAPPLLTAGGNSGNTQQ